MKKTPVLPLALVSCVALALSACDQKSTTANDPARERQLQELQDKITNLSSRSDELSRQLADRNAAEAEAKRGQLEKDQAELDRQKAQLEADREALARATPETTVEPVTVNDNSVSSEEAEPVYRGKPAGYDLFYTKLQDDGDWIESEDYGYIWQPNVTVRDSNWRPYSDGRWVDTDRGWTWDSNERFGWATYHYGRWVNLNSSGWCWVPGDEWAPAWVSWRSGDRYVGWAPLPPEARLQRGGSITASVDVEFGTGPAFFNFVDCEDFGESTYVGRLVQPEQNIVIINQTVNVTNITRNNLVINNFGPDSEAIRRRSRRPVNRYQLDLQPQFGVGVVVPHAQGNRLAVLAPNFVADGAGNNAVRPGKIAKKIVKVDRNKGWRGVQPDQAQAVKVSLEKHADHQTQQEQAEREQKQRQLARQAERAKMAQQTDDQKKGQPAGSGAAKEPKTGLNAPGQQEAFTQPGQGGGLTPAEKQQAARKAMQQKQAQENRAPAVSETQSTPDAGAEPEEKAPNDQPPSNPALEAQQRQAAQRAPAQRQLAAQAEQQRLQAARQAQQKQQAQRAQPDPRQDRPQAGPSDNQQQAAAAARRQLQAQEAQKEARREAAQQAAQAQRQQQASQAAQLERQQAAQAERQKANQAERQRAAQQQQPKPKAQKQRGAGDAAAEVSPTP